MFKIGSYAHLKYDFIIERYIKHLQLFEIAFPALPKHEDRLYVPIYLKTFNIYLPNEDFIMPGPNLPSTSPHYYEIDLMYGTQGSELMRRDLREEHSVSLPVIFEKKPHYLTLDKTFRRTGKYFLQSRVEPASIIVRYAPLRSRLEREMLIEDMLEKNKQKAKYGVYDRIGIGGTTSQIREVVYHERTQDKQTLYLDSIEEEDAYNTYDNVIIRLLDPKTKIIFEVPIKYLTLKR